MGNIIQFPTQTRVEDGALGADNPFLNSPLYEKLLKEDNERKPIAAELADIAARGAGAWCPDATQALSLELLRSSTKNRARLADVFTALSERQSGFDGKILTQFGIDIRRWAAQPGDPMLIAVDIGQYSLAAKFFDKAKVAHWRTLIAHDCKELNVVTPAGNIYHTVDAFFEIPTKR